MEQAGWQHVGGHEHQLGMTGLRQELCEMVFIPLCQASLGACKPDAEQQCG